MQKLQIFGAFVQKSFLVVGGTDNGIFRGQDHTGKSVEILIMGYHIIVKIIRPVVHICKKQRQHIFQIRKGVKLILRGELIASAKADHMVNSQGIVQPQTGKGAKEKGTVWLYQKANLSFFPGSLQKQDSVGIVVNLRF